MMVNAQIDGNDKPFDGTGFHPPETPEPLIAPVSEDETVLCDEVHFPSLVQVAENNPPVLASTTKTQSALKAYPKSPNEQSSDPD
jgi:hypothetical protein